MTSQLNVTESEREGAAAVHQTILDGCRPHMEDSGLDQSGGGHLLL